MFSSGGFFYLFSLPNLSRRRLDVDPTSKRLAENTDRKKSTKLRHLGTIAQLCQAVSSQLRDASTIWKKLVKQQYLFQTSSQYGELRPING